MSLDALKQKLIDATATQVRVAARQIQAQAAANALKAGPHRDAVAASIYVVDDEGTDYNEHLAETLSMPGVTAGQRGEVLPPAQLPSLPDGVVQAIIASPLAYAVLLHNGYYHAGSKRYIPGNPFLTAAMNEVKDVFLNELQQALKK